MNYDLPSAVAGDTFAGIESTGVSGKTSALTSLRMQVKVYRTDDNPLVDVDTSGGLAAGVIIDDADEWSFTVLPFQVPFVPRKYYYDIEATDADGKIDTIMSGEWRVEKPITRSSGELYSAFMRDSTIDLELFSDYDNQAWSTTCWARSYDLSGVSWEGSTADAGDARRCALVGRDCFVTAHHFSPQVGKTVTFTDRFGSAFTYEVASLSDELTEPGVEQDGRAGTFTTDVSDTLTSYDIELSPSSGDWLLATRSRASLADDTPYGQRATIERMTSWISSPNPASGNAKWYPSWPRFSGVLPEEILDRRYNAGTYDSSDVLFTATNGELKVYSTYHGIGNGPWYGFSTILAQVDAYLATQGTSRVVQAGVDNS